MTVAVITGASSGIGLELSLELSKHYDVVLATMRNPDEADKRLTSQQNIKVLDLDVTKKSSIEKLLALVKEHYDGKIDLLVNNAGIGIAGSVITIDEEVAKEVFEVNVWGVYRMCQMAFDYLKNGTIVMVPSTAGIRGLPASDVYCMSKFAVQGMAESLRYTAALDGIKVICVNPGPVDTPFINRWKGQDGGREDHSGEHARKLTMKIRERLEQRLKSEEAESSGECAVAITQTILEVKDKDPRKDVIPLVNGTSKRARHVINEILKDPSASQGEGHKALWRWSLGD